MIIHPVIFAPLIRGKRCDVKMPNGKCYSRIVRHCSSGLYVVIANRRYYESEMEIENNSKKGQSISNIFENTFE